MQRKCTSTCDFTENCTLKKASVQHTKTLLSVNTELWQVATTDIYSDTALTHPFCPPSLKTKPSTRVADLPGSEFEPWFVSLALLGWCPGRESRRTIPGRGEELPIALEKKCANHSSSSCTSPSPSLVSQKKPAATLTTSHCGADCTEDMG